MKQLNDSLWSRVAEKLAPGLTNVIIENDLKPIVINMSGAVNTQMLAVDGEIGQWSDFPFVLDALQSDVTSSWASQMLREKPMQVVKSGNNFVISNDPAIRVPMSTNSHLSDIGDTNLQTTWYEGDMIARLKKKKFSKTIGVKVAAVVDVVDPATTTQFDAVVNTIKLVHNDNIHGELDSRMRAMGHTYAKGIPILYGYTPNHNQSSFNGIDRWYNEDVAYAPLNTVLQKIGIPGVKWYVHYFGVGMNGSSLSPGMTAAWMGEGEPTYMWDTVHAENTIWPLTNVSGSTGTPLNSQTVGQFYCVPIIDSGESRFNMFSSIVSDMEVVKRRDKTFPDARYAGGTVGLGYDAEMAKLILDGSSIEVMGKQITLTDIQRVNWGTPGAIGGWTFLPFMTLPGLTQYMLCTSSTYVDEVMIYNDKEISVRTYSIIVSDYCTSFNHDWYVEYYTSGFGLYTPRDQITRKRVLDSWKGVEGMTYFVNLSSTIVTLDGKDIDSLDIRKSYKRAREKACKTDNFYEQQFNEKSTWGQVRDKIAEQGSFSAFIAANDGYHPTLQIKKALTKTYRIITENSIKVIELKSADGTVESVPITEDNVVRVFTECSNAPRTEAAATTDFGDVVSDWKSFITALSDFDAERNNRYLNYTPEMIGRNYVENYFFPWQSLGISGYPIFTAMNPQHRTMMVCRQVADLGRMLQPFVKIIDSFTTEAVIQKLKVSMT